MGTFFVLLRQLGSERTLRGLPLITYAPRGGWGVNPNAFKCVQGGRGGLIMIKIRSLYAGSLKMLHWLLNLLGLKDKYTMCI